MKTLSEIYATEEVARAEYEAKAVGMRDADGPEWTIAVLRASFDKHHRAGHWKDAVSVVLDVRTDDVVTFCRAVEFYQGDRPQVSNDGSPTRVRVTSRGYRG